MQKTILGVFAHPDDEAFFCSGTIAKLAKRNNVIILCATKGEAGEDTKKDKKTLTKRREKELRESAKILGVQKVYFLGFKDGDLSNNLYPKVAAKIDNYVKQLKPEILLSFPPNGATGHLDHIAISLISSFVFSKNSFIKQLWQACLLDERTKMIAKYYKDFIFVPKGYKRSEINKVIDVSDVWDLKIKAMQAHKSQATDIKQVLSEMNKFPKEEYILITKR